MKNSTLIKMTVIICAAILALFAAFPVYAGAEVGDRGEFYPRLTVVVEKEQLGQTWLITCQDKDGELWAFYNDEGEWDVGDIANLLMWNMHEREEDDEVVEVYWEGYIEDINLFFQMKGWR